MTDIADSLLLMGGLFGSLNLAKQFITKNPANDQTQTLRLAFGGFFNVSLQ